MIIQRQNPAYRSTPVFSAASMVYIYSYYANNYETKRDFPQEPCLFFLLFQLIYE